MRWKNNFFLSKIDVVSKGELVEVEGFLLLEEFVEGTLEFQDYVFYLT